MVSTPLRRSFVKFATTFPELVKASPILILISKLISFLTFKGGTNEHTKFQFLSLNYLPTYLLNYLHKRFVEGSLLLKKDLNEDCIRSYIRQAGMG